MTHTAGPLYQTNAASHDHDREYLNLIRFFNALSSSGERVNSERTIGEKDAISGDIGTKKTPLSLVVLGSLK